MNTEFNTQYINIRHMTLIIEQVHYSKTKKCNTDFLPIVGSDYNIDK